MPTAWFVISLIAFCAAMLLFLVAGFCLFRLLGQVIPLLDETKNQVQDLGDLAAHTVGSAHETLDLVEMRVSQAMGQAALSGKSAAKQALGVGTVLTGVYMAVRLLGMVRDMWSSKHKHDKRHPHKEHRHPARPGHRKWLLFGR